MIITISRQYATNGILIGRMVAERMNYHLYDREIVDELARMMSVHPVVINHLYESIADPVQSVLLEWRSQVTPNMYARYLRTALKAVVKEGDAVIVGRGANFACQDVDALNVRIVAPLALRIAVFRAGNDISEAEARKIITKRDQERATFIKTTFNAQIDDPLQYDLVINLASVTPELATEQIINAAKAVKRDQAQLTPEAIVHHHLQMMVKQHHHVRPEIVERYR